MRAASVNLTPITLELGGKSPVIIADDIDMPVAVERMAFAKCVNSGQVCISPDYVLCPEGKEDAFIAAYTERFQAMYKEASASEDHTSIINERQYQRLKNWLEDARAKGATIVSADGKGTDDTKRKMATQLITNTTDDMMILQQEIFGPLLPIISYKTMDDAIAYVNARPRPLALYIMSFDKKVQQQVLTRTHSGGVCVNDTIFHFVADDAPFGGVGPSGMGHYHGKEGFLNFTKAKKVLTHGKFHIGKYVQPPYSRSMVKVLLGVFMR
jgi:coniferyl-aldehyde dehydrogenase